MNCLHCQSDQTSKNGTRNGKQNYICKCCGKQFLESYSQRGYSDDIKKICIKMRKSGMKYREIEKMTGVSHNTVILWMHHLKESLDTDEAD